MYIKTLITVYAGNSSTQISVLPSKKPSEVLGKPAGFVHFDLHTKTAPIYHIVSRDRHSQSSSFSVIKSI